MGEVSSPDWFTLPERRPETAADPQTESHSYYQQPTKKATKVSFEGNDEKTKPKRPQR